MLIILSFLTCCCSVNEFRCPYVITESRIETGKSENYYDFAGAYITLNNCSEKSIKSFTVCFSVFDSKGNAAGNISNFITTDYTGIIESSKSRQIIVNLDSLMRNCFEKDYKIGFIYVSQIKYTDGSIWQDLTGLYCL